MSSIQPEPTGSSGDASRRSDYLDYLEALSAEMIRLEAALDEAPGIVQIDGLRSDNAKGRSASEGFGLGPGRVRVEGNFARRALLAVVETTARHTRQADGLGLLPSYLSEEGSGAEELLVRAAGGDPAYCLELAARLSLDPLALRFAAVAAAMPIYRHAARRLGTVAEAGAEPGRCPSCGTRPWISRLQGDEGRRILECPLCATSWPVARLRCPFCGNDDARRLGQLSVEGEPYRVDVCDGCRSYVKAFDGRSRGAARRHGVALVEDALTLYLDVLASNEGYASRRDVVDEGASPIRAG